MALTNILVFNPKNTLHSTLQSLPSDFSVQLFPKADEEGTCGTFVDRLFDLLVVDASEQSCWEGLALAKSFKEGQPYTPIIIFTREGSEDFALAVLRAGINDFLKEPIRSNELSASIARCLSGFPKFEPIPGPRPPSSPYIAETLIGESQTMKELRGYLTRVSETDSNVLITGETGTGKELVARLIHENSIRRKKPFICVNCAAIPDTLLESELFGHERGAFTGAVGTSRGKMELAQGGTIFFDEIGDMSPTAQAKILRAIEERKIYRLGGKSGVPLNVRVLAATNQDLDLEMNNGRFRKDLYYRLNVARISLPPLQERREDVPHLLQHYIREFNQKFRRHVEGFTYEAQNFLFEYSWPGNVRELINLVEASFINLPPRQIQYLDLPKPFETIAKESEHLPQTERDRILTALLTTNWNRNKAAEKLACSRMTLYRKMVKYQVSSAQPAKIKGNKVAMPQINEHVTTLSSTIPRM